MYIRESRDKVKLKVSSIRVLWPENVDPITKPNGRKTKNKRWKTLVSMKWTNSPWFSLSRKNFWNRTVNNNPTFYTLFAVFYGILVALYFICRQVVPIKILPECIFVQFIKLQTDTLVWKWIFLTKEFFNSPNKPPSIPAVKLLLFCFLFLKIIW